MYSEIPIYALLNLFAGMNAMIIGAAFFRLKNLNNAKIGNRFAGILVCVGYLLAVFALTNSMWLRYGGFLKISHDATALLLGALFLDYVLCALQRKPLSAWGYAPVTLYLLMSVIVGESFFERLEIVHLVITNIIYLLAALSIYIAWIAGGLSSGPRPQRVINVECLLLATGIIYALQFIQLGVANSSLLFVAVPIMGACILFLFFGVFIFFRPLSERFVTLAMVKATGKLHVDLSHISTVIREQELFLDLGLTVSGLARQLDYKPRELSGLINDQMGCSFQGFINGFRTDKAKALLIAKEEEQTSIEAIGLLCGFRSRSTFYDAFRRNTGKTPGEYRKQLATA